METIRKITKLVVTEKYVPVVEGMFYRVAGKLYEGEPLICPCCLGHFRKFLTFRGKKDERCPGCGSLRRHRLIWLYLKQCTSFFSGQMKVLHFAPEYVFQKVFERLPNLEYITADWSSPRSMLKMDITNIEFPPNTFDVIITNHVLEHIPDDRKAMRELHRVLKPQGFAILQSPVNRNRQTTYEDPTITSPIDRKREFGQEDHVRIYGLDYKQRLEECGFHVKADDYGSHLGEDQIRQYSLPAGEPVYYCTKN